MLVAPLLRVRPLSLIPKTVADVVGLLPPLPLPAPPPPTPPPPPTAPPTMLLLGRLSTTRASTSRMLNSIFSAILMPNHCAQVPSLSEVAASVCAAMSAMRSSASAAVSTLGLSAERVASCSSNSSRTPVMSMQTGTVKSPRIKFTHGMRTWTPSMMPRDNVRPVSSSKASRAALRTATLRSSKSPLKSETVISSASISVQRPIVRASTRWTTAFAIPVTGPGRFSQASHAARHRAQRRPLLE